MPYRITFAAQRLAIARLTLDLLKAAAKVNLGDDAAYGTHSTELAIFLAVIVGQLEGRPLSVSKVATYAGMPRASVDRKLREMCAVGSIKRTSGLKYFIPTERMNSADRVAITRQLAEQIKGVATVLSKMDT